MKIPCYTKVLVSIDKPKECLPGSPWVDKMAVIMGGKTSDEKVDFVTHDNFHRVYVTTPHHLPQINNTCPENGPKPCTLQGLTVSENVYDKLTPIDFGTSPHAALETRTKFLSRQSI